MEPLSNMGFVCQKCSLKPDPRFANLPPSAFVGRSCKLAFPVASGARREYMWVRVTEHDGDELIGFLDNDPIFEVGYEHGDRIGFKRDEIIACLPE